MLRRMILALGLLALLLAFGPPSRPALGQEKEQGPRRPGRAQKKGGTSRSLIPPAKADEAEKP